MKHIMFAFRGLAIMLTTMGVLLALDKFYVKMFVQSKTIGMMGMFFVLFIIISVLNEKDGKNEFKKRNNNVNK